MTSLFDSEVKKNQTKNMTITNRAIIIAMNNFLRKNPRRILVLSTFSLLILNIGKKTVNSLRSIIRKLKPNVR